MTKNGVCVWDFSYPKDRATIEEMKEICKQHCKAWAFQLEKGEKDGYLHYQGRVSLKVKARKGPKIVGMRWSATTDENKDNIYYVTKEDTRVEGPWTDKDKVIYVPRQYRDITLWPFQQDIVKSGSVFDPRGIDLIYDPDGLNGKSTIAAICEILYGGIDMPPLNDFKELIQLCCDICMDTGTRDPKMILFDLPRAINKECLNGLYSAIEQIKKGKLYDCRYHYKAYWIDSPRCWVFSNHLPDETLLSNDRWRIWTINKVNHTLERFFKAGKPCNIRKKQIQ